MEATNAPLFQDDAQPSEAVIDLPETKTACIVAIDPGLTGAVAFYFPSAPDRIAVEDMPVVNGEVDSHGLNRLIQRMGPTLAIIEHVNAMPSIPGKGGQRRSMGAQSAFNFGRAFEAGRTTLALSGAPLHLALPKDWKKHFRLSGGDEGKEAGRALAIRLFPACAERFARKKDHGRADAALLARYAAEALR